MKKIQIGVCVDGLRQITLEQSAIYKLIRKEYARLTGIDENRISLVAEITEQEETKPEKSEVSIGLTVLDFMKYNNKGGR